MNRLPRRGRDAGMGLVAVIAVTAIMATLVIASTAIALSSLHHGKRTADWDAALAAAYAGVEEYRSNLTSDATYQRYGNPAAPFTVASGSAPLVVLPPTPNPAFGLGPDGSWATVPGSDGAARYRYEVDTAGFGSDGLIRVRSTGAVGEHTRSVVASITQDGYIRFLYWSDYELTQSMAESADCKDTNWNTAANRLKYSWEGRSDIKCVPQAFLSRDVLDGPVYTNDHLWICGTKFKGPVYSMTTKTPRYTLPEFDCDYPTFAVPGGPMVPDSKIEMPATSSELRRETRSDLPGVPRPGCLYTGPTSITFTGDGYMQVRSRWTRYTQVAGNGSTSGSNNVSRCGMPGTQPGQLGSTGGARVPVIEGSLAYVQNVPSVTTDVNYTAQTAANRTALCGASDDSANGLGYPTTNEWLLTAGTYGCAVGDVFASGVLDGRTTIVAENRLWVVGDMTYAGTDDILGLIGQTSVTVWHPLKAYNMSLFGKGNRKIEAAILSVNGTFEAQSWGHGDPIGVLHVYGSIAQKYRGRVGGDRLQGGAASGYDKNYRYDPRFETVTPPKFLRATNTAFKTGQIAEVSPAFDTAGNAH